MITYYIYNKSVIERCVLVEKFTKNIQKTPLLDNKSVFFSSYEFDCPHISTQGRILHFTSKTNERFHVFGLREHVVGLNFRYLVVACQGFAVRKLGIRRVLHKLTLAFDKPARQNPQISCKGSRVAANQSKLGNTAFE